MKKVLAIDPGVAGAFVITDGKMIETHAMPIEIEGKEKRVHFGEVHELVSSIRNRYGPIHVFLERAIPMAMGSKGAFNYGRGFEGLIIALRLVSLPMTLVEPGRWTKEMHEGISADLKPKAKSLIAVRRLYPHLVAKLPSRPKGGLHDGPIDALLIAGYGLRKMGLVEPDVIGDFY